MVYGIKIQTERKIGSRFSNENRSAIFRSKLISDFVFSTAIRFSDQNCDRNSDQKLFRKNRSAILISKILFANTIAIKNRSKKKRTDFPCKTKADI